MKRNKLTFPPVPPVAGLAVVMTGALMLLATNAVFGQVNLERYRADKVYENGEHYEAMQMYKKLLDNNPNDAELNYNIGNTLYKMNLPNEALQFYQRALSNTNDNELRADIEYNMANAMFKSGKLPEAIEGYKQVLRKRPDDQDARFNLEYAMKRLDKERPPPQKGENNRQSERDQNQSKSEKDKKKGNDRSKAMNQDRDDKDQNLQPRSGQSQTLSRKDAERLLDALKHQEKEYQKKKVKEKAQTEVQSEKDW